MPKVKRNFETNNPTFTSFRKDKNIAKERNTTKFSFIHLKLIWVMKYI